MKGWGITAEKGRGLHRVGTAIRWVAVFLALTAVVVVVGTSAIRVGYPFELEWLEGGTLIQVQRVLDGEPMYVQPSISYVPFLYAPLYYYVCAAVSWVAGPGLASCRVVSFGASVGMISLIGAWIRRRTGRWDAAIIGAGLFSASYRLSGEWFEVARTDSLSVFLFLTAAFLLDRDWDLPWVGDVFPGFFLALSALTKQNTPMMAVPLVLWVFVRDWGRGIRVAATAIGLYAFAAVLINALTGGWFWYFTVILPSRHGLAGSIDQWIRFWKQDLFGPLMILAGLTIGLFLIRMFTNGSGRRHLGQDAALLFGFIGAAWAGRMNPGGFNNVMMPAFLGLALFVGLGFGWLVTGEREERSIWRTATIGVVSALLIVQFALLRFDPRTCLPTQRDRVAGAELVERLSKWPGDVLIPDHPYLLLLAGKPTNWHSSALTELIGGYGETEPDSHGRAVLAQIEASIPSQRWSAIILDGPKKPGAVPWAGHLGDHYRILQDPIFDQPEVFMPVTGAPRQPRFLLVPIRPEGNTATGR